MTLALDPAMLAALLLEMPPAVKRVRHEGDGGKSFGRRSAQTRFSACFGCWIGRGTSL